MYYLHRMVISPRDSLRITGHAYSDKNHSSYCMLLWGLNVTSKYLSSREQNLKLTPWQKLCFCSIPFFFLKANRYCDTFSVSIIIIFNDYSWHVKKDIAISKYGPMKNHIGIKLKTNMLWHTCIGFLFSIFIFWMSLNVFQTSPNVYWASPNMKVFCVWMGIKHPSPQILIGKL